MVIPLHDYDVIDTRETVPFELLFGDSPLWNGQKVPGNL